jgi:hypothetical protein
MRKSRKLLNCLLALFLVSAIGCAEKKSSKKSTNTTDTTTTSPTSNTTIIDTGNGSGSNSGNDPDAPGIDDGNQTEDYYTLANIKVHGRAHFTAYNSVLNPGSPDYMTNPSAGVFWSSESGISAADQGIFLTNSRFNVRIVPRPVEYGSSVMDWSGDSANRCYRASSYSKLKLTICVRKESGGCIYQHTFDAEVNKASNVKEFNFPNSPDPLIVEVLNAESDYNCELGNNSYCPYGGHDHPACMKFDIQFSTDQTKDLPGTRY